MSLKSLILQEIKSILGEQKSVSFSPRTLPKKAENISATPASFQQKTGTDASSAEYKRAPMEPEDTDFTGAVQTKTDAGLPELTTSEKELPADWGFEGPEQTKTDAGALKKMPLFRPGSRGPAVKKLQTILATQGFDDELRGKSGQLTDVELSKVADGIYGPRTKKSVMKFQQIAKLPVTGVISQKDWDTLKKWGTGKNVVSAPVTENKNWLDKTRESATSNLFERLVRNVRK